jgi:hypothetical protein
MDREDIIRMARESGLVRTGDKWVEPARWGVTEIERFAELVAKHTLANIDPSSFMSWQEGHETGRLAEREACAKVCDDWPNGRDDVYSIGAAIRARGNT